MYLELPAPGLHAGNNNYFLCSPEKYPAKKDGCFALLEIAGINHSSLQEPSMEENITGNSLIWANGLKAPSRDARGTLYDIDNYVKSGVLK